MDDLAKRFSKIGTSMLLVVVFLFAAAAVGVTNLELVIGLVVLAAVIRLNLWRIDRKFAKSRPREPD